jgi:hypothetical protein
MHDCKCRRFHRMLEKTIDKKKYKWVSTNVQVSGAFKDSQENRV